MFVWVNAQGRAFGFSMAAHPDTEVNSIEVSADIAAVLEADPTKVVKLETSPEGLVWSTPPKVQPRGYARVRRDVRVSDYTIVLDRVTLTITGVEDIDSVNLAVCKDSMFDLLYLIPLSSGSTTFLTTKMAEALADPNNLLFLQGVDPRIVVTFTQSYAVS